VILTSHNLRTPLSIINGNSELLGRTKLDGNQQHMLKALQAGSVRLGSLIEDLLTISQLEAGDKLSLSSVDLKELVDPIIEESQVLAATSHIKFETKLPEESLAIQVNPSRFATAIMNLINNAFKFTKEGSVTLTVKTSANNLLFQIADTGIGIAHAEIPKLFTKFHRGDNDKGLAYNFSGEGIGLYLTKLIVDEHGGTIKVDSEPGKGSTFTVSLPLQQKS
jgi:signal transduction histidine kinase